MVNTFMRLTALTILFEKLIGRPQRPAPVDVDALSDAEFDSLYGVTGDEMIAHMDTFEFAPGAVDEMMAAIDETFEREPEAIS